MCIRDSSKAVQSFLTELDNYTLADLVEENQPLYKLLLVEGISLSGDNISGAIWGCMGYTVLLCFTLFKTGSLAKSLFGAH